MITSKTYRILHVSKRPSHTFWELGVSGKSFPCLKLQIGPLTSSCIFITATSIPSSQTTQPRWECEPSCPHHFHTIVEGTATAFWKQCQCALLFTSCLRNPLNETQIKMKFLFSQGQARKMIQHVQKKVNQDNNKTTALEQLLSAFLFSSIYFSFYALSFCTHKSFFFKLKLLWSLVDKIFLSI